MMACRAEPWDRSEGLTRGSVRTRDPSEMCHYRWGGCPRTLPPGVRPGQEAKRMGSVLVSAGLVELALFTMT